jgi:hypothetical protein
MNSIIWLEQSYSGSRALAHPRCCEITDRPTLYYTAFTAFSMVQFWLRRWCGLAVTRLGWGGFVEGCGLHTFPDAGHADWN